MERLATPLAVECCLCYHLIVIRIDLSASFRPPFTVIQTMDRLYSVDGRMLVVADFPSTRLSDDSDFMLYRGHDPRDEVPTPLQPV
jgi:hypothetical protein